MRLSKLKMAGFKSFVDPTVIQFPSDLTGIVGPNGCGKSNIIDAVRLVMGETSRHLRGESMEDVIFNGSSGRKPVGQASVELIFDNSDGSLGGEYAQYSEISLRRVVARDGTSKYFLNGAHCRRKDVVDIFLGTGLGPHSYAIIGQGMISRLVQAKPEELRGYLEEAAGISRYKERRRETETRISHSRENLSRLEDVRTEVDQQLEKLKRQSKAAERFQSLRQRQAELKTQVLALRYRDLRAEAAHRELARSDKEAELVRVQAELEDHESRLDQVRKNRELAAAKLGQVQSGQYQASAERVRCEQAVRSASEQCRRQQEELASSEESRNRIALELAQELSNVESAKQGLSEAEPALVQTRQESDLARSRLTECESALSEWQDLWAESSRNLAETRRGGELEAAEISHLQKELGSLEERRSQLAGITNSDPGLQLKTEESALSSEYERTVCESSELDAKLQQASSEITSLRQRQQQLGQELDGERRCGQDLSGKLASLHTLQGSALHAGEQGFPEWLARNGLEDAPRLAQRLLADAGWDRAAEAVLGERLEAVCVPSIEELCAKERPPAKTVLFEPVAVPESVVSPYSLHHKLRSPWPLDGWLANVYVASNLEQALALRRTLGEHESVVTSDGDWISRRWMKVAGGGYSGVLAREQEIKALVEALSQSNIRLNQMETELASAGEMLASTEQERSRLQTQREQIGRHVASLSARITEIGLRLRQFDEKCATAKLELGRIEERERACRDLLEISESKRQEAVRQAQEKEAEASVLGARRDSLRDELAQARAAAQSCADAVQSCALRVQALRGRMEAADAAVRRHKDRAADFESASARLKLVLAESEQSVAEWNAALSVAKEAFSTCELELAEARQALESAEAGLNSADAERQRLRRVLDEVRLQVDEIRMVWQEASTRIAALTEQFLELGVGVEEAVAALPAEIVQVSISEELADIESRIARLGPINLAAIDEHKALSERKTYLDAQQADLSEALSTLEDAMRKIDRETRSRFDDIFTRVNVKLDESFVRLFGGGGARLEVLSDESGLGGVAIAARPPGKTFKNINLLSGGEQTLTAVALVFAIFSLNPAPFCLLDEADAALDEANVGRFCELVKAMSQTVQFIIVTHNKTTMEYTHQLVGVTMQEPGVSRLVAVDIDQALRMTEEKTVLMAAVG